MSKALTLRNPDFSRLESEVQEAQRKRAALEKMLDVLKQNEHFDEHDLRSVEEALLVVLKDEKVAREELERRHKIYKETLAGAQEQLKQRHAAMSILNDSTEAFELFPELASKFAQRQSQMLQLVEEATRKLEA